MAAVFIDIHTHNTGIEDDSSQILRIHNVALNHGEDVQHRPSTAGIHPWDIDYGTLDNLFNRLNGLLTERAIIGIGECGLDKVTSTDFTLQREVFVAQIQLAQTHHMPLIVHCVRAFQEVVELLRHQQHTGRVIFHGFQKNKSLADLLLRKGYLLSFGQSVFQGRLDSLLMEIPSDRFFLETDTAAVPIASIYEYVAKIRNVEVSQLQEQIFKNYQSVFH